MSPKKTSSLFSTPELVEQIVDFLYADKESIRACLYTAHAWVIPAQFHLFNALDIVSEKQCKRLMDSISSAPYLAGYIRTLRIHFPWVDPLLSLEKLQLPNLRTLALANCPTPEELKRAEHLITLPSLQYLRLWSTPLSCASEVVADEDTQFVRDENAKSLRVGHLLLSGRIVQNAANLLAPKSPISRRIGHLTYSSSSVMILSGLLASPIGTTLCGLTLSASLLLGNSPRSHFMLSLLHNDELTSEMLDAIPGAETFRGRQWLPLNHLHLPALRHLRLYDVAVSDEYGLESEALKLVDWILSQMEPSPENKGRSKAKADARTTPVATTVEHEPFILHLSLRPYPRDCRTRGSDYLIEPAPDTDSDWMCIDQSINVLAAGHPLLPYRIAHVRIDRDERAFIDSPGEPVRPIEGGRSIWLTEVERTTIRGYLPQADALGLLEFKF
ncbi:hypothetical protein HMN09_00034700 [Mycena chlorophos]|uniref:Uncharacterized protein n=1 Tax=Mycena chlorophos TaxID=658473 RepID=A0A8H6WM84_MYCCL|nr:hypothetical protein HMN09_00034700 [Mycena chlorophos]